MCSIARLVALFTLGTEAITPLIGIKAQRDGAWDIPRNFNEETNPMKPKITWILMANAGQARICLNEGRNDGVHEIEGMIFENEHLPARDIMTDKPGRAYDSVGGGRHAMEYSSDPTEHSEQQFAEKLSSILDKALDGKRFDRLSIAAGPSMLAHLRTALTPATRKLIHAEIDKDYTKTPVQDLPEVLRIAGAID